LGIIAIFQNYFEVLQLLLGVSQVVTEKAGSFIKTNVNQTLMFPKPVI
jgi:hypothetical protein